MKYGLPDEITLPVITERLSAPHTTMPPLLSVVASTGSTNEDALRAAAEGAPHGSVFIADEQTAGRGRLGRTWHSPAGQGVYLSMLLRPNIDPDRIASITLAAGLGVAEGISEFLPPCSVWIKWPNDLMIFGKKIGGILTEASSVSGKVDHLVIGVGINVLQTEFDPEIQATATSMSLQVSPDRRRIDVIAEVIHALARRMREFAETGFAPMREEVVARDYLADRQIRVQGIEGTGSGIDNQGRLAIFTDAAKRVFVTSGEVEVFGRR